MQREAAETLSLEALAHVIADDKLGPAFLDATGIAPADLAARAAEIHAAHVVRKRGKLPAFAVVPQWRPAQPDPVEAKPADIALSPQAEERLTVEKPASDAIADLVSRAASIHAAHVAKNRKGLTAYTIPARPSLGEPTSQEAGPGRGKTH